MKLARSILFGLIAVTGAVPAAVHAQAQAQAQAAAQPAVKVSPGAAKALTDLQKTVNAKDTANIPAKVAAAQAVAKTADDRFFIAEMQLKAAIDSNDRNAAIAAADAIAASGFPATAHLVDLYSGIGGQFYEAKDFARAETYFRKALALNPASTKTMLLVGEALHGAGKGAEAAQIMYKALSAAQTAGVKLEEKSYKRAAGIAFDAKSALALPLSKLWVKNYPDPESWSNAVGIYQRFNGTDKIGNLAFMRLLRLNKALRDPNAYLIYAGSAADLGNTAEALAVLKEGADSGILNTSTGDGAAVYKEVKAKPVATVAELDKAGAAAKTGSAKMAIGNRYLGLGQYAKAAELFRAAATAGADKDAANLQLGIALAESGDKAGAVAAFKSAGGIYLDVASYWLLYLGQ